ncbi:MAG: glycosyltransferase family 4 protein [Nitrospira sp.]|nr:glycosyltransferase family 4 protein [Nitrospira sp.]
MILGIDAFNIQTGGGVTHLTELLGAADPLAHGFDRVFIWSSVRTLDRICDREWLTKVSDPLLNQGLPYRVYWNRFRQRKLAHETNCDVVFLPGGSGESGFTPIVTMSQNLLPFEWGELKRYGCDSYTIKLLFLRWTQCRTFKKANGVIFLTNYARRVVTQVTGELRGECPIIPHGINSRFMKAPRRQQPLSSFTKSRPCRVLYVSIVDVYKHQWHVAEAVAMLREENIPIVLELVGPPAKGMQRLRRAMERLDPAGSFLVHHGAVPYENLDGIYAAADICVFASSCENMPNILLEGMAAGLPMACSRMGPMPEVLGDAGVYFNPEDTRDIAQALRDLIDSHDLRARLAEAAFVRAQSYSWKWCADDTFRFFARVARGA